MAMVNFLAPFLIFAAVLYGFFCAYLFLMQSRLLYYPNLPSREVSATPLRIGLKFEEVTLATSDNIKISGWYVPAQQARGALLFFHGNAGNISHRLDSLAIFNRLGLASLIIDYRGYGESEGRVSEKGTYLDAEAAWRYLTETKQTPPENIIIFGRSLGGAIGAHLAALPPPGGLIVESAFTSVPDMAAQLYPFLPVRLLSRFQYNTKEALQSCSCPVLIIHSPDDEIMPYSLGEKVYEAANEPKHFIKMKGSHNYGFFQSQPMYELEMGKWLARIED